MFPSTKLAFLAIIAIATATPTIDSRQNARQSNDNRPVPVGACCVANTSLKQDFCTTPGGAQGRCVPANSAGCNERLTCIAQTALTCSATELERGRPLCRPT